MERTFFALALLLSACSSSGGLPPGDSDLKSVDLGGDGGACNTMSCAAPFKCCGERCVFTQNDPFNCGGCGAPCPGPNPYCEAGVCKTPPCNAQRMCDPNGFCCDLTCCGPGQLCCLVDGPGPARPASCYTPTTDQPTCPRGCPLCR